MSDPLGDPHEEDTPVEERFNVPTPRLSPSPPLAPEGDTNPGQIVTVGALKTKMKTAARKGYAKSGGVGLAALLALAAFIDKRASAQVDAGTRVLNQQIKFLDDRQTRHENEETAIHLRESAEHARFDAKLDAMLTRFQIPNPAPAPKDAGP